MTPLEANYEETAKLKQDNFSVGEFWVVCDGVRVTFAKQREGSPATQAITIPVEDARELIKFLTTEQ